MYGGKSMKWLPILRAESEDSHIFVQTDRGIEPAEKIGEFCNNAIEGDFALCKSEKGHLVMMDYSKDGVNV